MWRENSKLVHEKFKKNFWNNELQRMNQKYPFQESKEENLIYWWHAHVIDVLLDAYEREGSIQYIHQIDQVLNSVIKANGNTILHNWYDDMEWMALALLRAYDCTKNERYKQLVYTLWEDIKGAWNNQMGGGLAWKKDQLDYKNTPANGPAAIIGARLYQRFHQEEDLHWAEKIYYWNKNTLQDPETGFIWDGINRLGDGGIDKDWEFSYCQGVMIGAAVELYKCTEDKTFLDNSIRIMEVAFEKLVNEKEVLKYEGYGDAGLFKGIFVRYLVVLYKLCPHLKEIESFLEYNARVLLSLGYDEEKGLFGAAWDKMPDGEVDLSSQLSGMMLIEAVEWISKNADEK